MSELEIIEPVEDHWLPYEAGIPIGNYIVHLQKAAQIQTESAPLDLMREGP